jgi:integrase
MARSKQAASQEPKRWARHTAGHKAERTNLTRAAAMKLPLPEQGRRLVWDGGEKGNRHLAVRLSANGSRKWVCVVTVSPVDAAEELRKAGKPLSLLPASKQQWFTIGDVSAIGHDEARDRARDLHAQAAKGRLPNQEKREADLLAQGGRVPLVEVWAKIKERIKNRSASHRVDFERVVTMCLAANLRDLSTDDLAPRFDSLLRARSLSDATRKRYLGHMRALCAQACRMFKRTMPAGQMDQLLADHDSSNTPPPAFFELKEAFMLASDDALSTEWGRVFYFLLATGCRYKEGSWARWSRIDLERGTYAIAPPSDPEREQGFAVKRDKQRTVILGQELIQELKEWRRGANESDFVFSQTSRPKAHNVVTRAWRSHLARLGVALGKRTPHTLRHQHAAMMTAAACNATQLQLSLGHGGAALTAHYARQANRWATMLRPWAGELRLRSASEVARLESIA